MDLNSADYSSGISWGGNPGALQEDLNASNNREGTAIARQPVQINYANANSSLAQAAGLAQQDAAMRGQQTAGLNLLQQQSMGQAPSAAAIQANAGTQSGYLAALQAQAAGHTSLAQAALSRQGLMAGGQAQIANVANAANARGQEYAQANQAFGNAAGQARASDYGLSGQMTSIGGMQGQMANAQSQQNLAQQQLNQQYAENQEQQRYNIGQTLKAGEQDTLNRYYGDTNQVYRNQLNNDQIVNNLAGATTSALGSAMAGAGTGMFGGSGGGSSFPTQTMSYGTGGVSSGGVMSNQAYAAPSDARAKTAAWDVLPLYDVPEGYGLRQGDDGRGFYAAEAGPTEQTIGGGLPTPSLASAAALRPAPQQLRDEQKVAQAAAQPTKRHEMTYDELMAAANAMEKQQNAYYGASLGQAPAVQPDDGVVADGNRAMAGQPYRYRPEFTPPDEIQGQVHHGFMAQNLERNPVTATAVEVDPSGLKKVHTNRMLQVVASGVADLQRQMDETRAAMKGAR